MIGVPVGGGKIPQYSSFSALPSASSFGTGVVQVGGATLNSTGQKYKLNRFIIGTVYTKQLLPGLAIGATYSQTGTTITVTSLTHGIPATCNGAAVYLVVSTGAAVSGWFNNFQYIDANSFSVTSNISQTTSGNLINITSGLYTFTNATITIPAKLMQAGTLLDAYINYSAAASSGSNRSIRLAFNNDTTISNCLLYAQFAAGQQVTHNCPTAIFRSPTSLRTTQWASLYDANNADQEVTAFDFNLDVTLTPIFALSGTANDYICIESLIVRAES